MKTAICEEYTVIDETDMPGRTSDQGISKPDRHVVLGIIAAPVCHSSNSAMH